MNIFLISFPKAVDLQFKKSRSCPICGGRPTSSAFPYAARFNDIFFRYLKCKECNTVFIDPVPDSKTFALMYTKTDYHDNHYNDYADGVDYLQSVSLLMQFLKPGSTLLDYGCGVGGFLKICDSKGLVSIGVEYDVDVAQFAAKNSNCEVMSIDAFFEMQSLLNLDAIHLGDVLEHLPDPTTTLVQILKHLKPGGIVFIEGPLEENHNPVYWASKIYGYLKRIIKPSFVSTDPPTHLYRTSSIPQKEFFLRLDTSLSIKFWEVYETGWPYRSGGLIKRFITFIALLIGGRTFAGLTFGNRFKAILVKS
jgi:2-polyprenyl-3-methyl-5-hydroxy-6-metoxy-1,4-benzoquinol methylase